MPLDSTGPTSTALISQAIERLLAAAGALVPQDKAEALIRKFMPRADVEKAAEKRLLCMMADATLLADDLLLSVPSLTGSTAFDRLARQHRTACATETAAIAALRRSRYRLVLLQPGKPRGPLYVRDELSRDILRIVNADLPPLPAHTPLFARIAEIGDGIFCFAGMITPLDEAAFRLAASHPSSVHPATSANTRWAEAIFAHVVRFGTLEIPGVNRPAAYGEDYFEAEVPPAESLARAWVALAGSEPGADLLQRTRELADVPNLLDGLRSIVLSRGRRDHADADTFERIVLVFIETIQRREQTGSRRLSLDDVAHHVDNAIAAKHLPAAARDLFRDLRRRVAGQAATGADTPELARLMQRIQGLRAKTVERGCTEQEALAAAEKIAELLDRYGLSLGELDFRNQPCDGLGIETDRRRAAPIDSCILSIAAFFDCRVWLENRKGEPLRYIFFGIRADVTAAQYLYELVERAFETETANFRAGPIYAEMAGERRSATNSFQIGLATGIRRKLIDLRAARNTGASSGRDLVPIKTALVDEELAKLGLSLAPRGSGRSRSRHVLSEAFEAGTQAAARFDYTPGISAAA